MKELIDSLKMQTEILLKNVEITINAIDDETLGKEYFNLQIWRHYYHMLHSLDQWFINPYNYIEPEFHLKGMNTLDENIKMDFIMNKQDFKDYYIRIRDKIYHYVNSLTDNDLMSRPEKSKFTIFELILAQYRHSMYHIGFIHSIIKSLNGLWPKFAGISNPIDGITR